MKNINILGGGVAGLTTALLLSDDFKVAVNAQPNHNKPHSQVIKNYDNFDVVKFYKKYGFKYNFQPVNKITKYLPNYSYTLTSTNGPLFFILNRGNTHNNFDFLLKEFCKNKGVSFSSNYSIRKNDIIAFGSKVNNFFAYGKVFDKELVKNDEIGLFIDQDILPGGYVYVCSSDNLTSVILVKRKNPQNISKIFNSFVKKFPTLSSLINSENPSEIVSGGSLSALPNSAIYGKKMFVGSAAGFVEYSRGFGLKYAMLSSKAVANSLIEETDYDSEWKKLFYDELLFGARKGLLFEKFSNKQMKKIFEIENNKVEDYKKYLNEMDGFFLKPKVFSSKVEELGRYSDLQYLLG